MGDLNIKFNPRNFQDLITAPLEETRKGLTNITSEVGKGIETIGQGTGQVFSEINKGLGSARTAVDMTGKGVTDFLGATAGVSAQSGASAINQMLTNPAQGFKNIEKNVGERFADLSYAVNTGDWTSFVNRTLSSGAGFGVLSTDRVTEISDTKSGKQKMAEKAANEVKQAELTAVANAEKTKLAAINAYMGSLVQARKKTPGVSQTLLGQYNPNSSSLISPRGR